MVDNDQCKKGENQVPGTNGQSSSFENGFLVTRIFSSHMNILYFGEVDNGWFFTAVSLQKPFLFVLTAS